MTTFKTVELDAQNRLTLNYDLTRVTLNEVIGDGVYVHFLNPNMAHNSTPSPITQELTDFIDGLAWSHDVKKPYSEVLLPALDGFFTAQGYDWMEITLRGYSQGEWAWAVMFKPKAETPDYEFELKTILPAVDAWFKGDIFTVTHETLEIYTKLKDGSILERWEPSDSIGGIIFNDADDIEEIKALGLDYFEMVS